MSNFGETLFGGSAFLRWTLSPLLLLFAIVMPLLLDSWTPTKVVLTAGMDLLCILVLIGFWTPPSISRLAFRAAAALVFVAYAGYLVHEFAGDKPLLPTRRSAASPFNALLGFVVIGLPSLCYAALGRFTWREPPPPEAEDEEELDDSASSEDKA